uniref:Uso1_p115_head domain-containing protein n=1 Tax=Echinostoma caproni TaxID=27848 RepID=A0A183B6R0_9TREM
LLCGGLFSNDVLSTWFSSIALLHCIRDNPRLKEELLRVLLASNPDGTPVSLLQQCFQWLVQANRPQTRIGILQLLCTWLAHCPAAVRRFLSAPSNEPVNGVASQSASTGSVARGANLSVLIAEVATVVNEDETEVAVRGLITLLTCICVLFNSNDVPGFDRYVSVSSSYVLLFLFAVFVSIFYFFILTSYY